MFDGDVLNILPLLDQKFVQVFDRVFNPRYMYIDRNTGMFNKSFSLQRDQLIGLNQFNIV